MGVRAIDLLKTELSSRVIVVRNGEFDDLDIEEALKMERSLDEDMYLACNRIDNSLQFRHR